MKISLDLWRRTAAWLTAAVTIALTIVGVVLQVRSPSGSSWEGGTNYLTLIHPIISVLVGAVIIDRKGNHLVGWLFCLSGFAWGLSHLAFGYGSYLSSLSSTGQLPLESQVLWSAGWAAPLAFGLAPVLVFLFPNGHLASPRWGFPFAAASAGIALGSIGTAFAPGRLEDLPEVNNPYGLDGAAGEVMRIMRDLSWPLLLLRLRDRVDLGSLSRELVGVVGSTMQPAHASLWLRNGSEANALQSLPNPLPDQRLRSDDFGALGDSRGSR